MSIIIYYPIALASCPVHYIIFPCCLYSIIYIPHVSFVQYRTPNSIFTIIHYPYILCVCVHSMYLRVFPCVCVCVCVSVSCVSVSVCVSVYIHINRLLTLFLESGHHCIVEKHKDMRMSSVLKDIEENLHSCHTGRLYCYEAYTLDCPKWHTIPYGPCLKSTALHRESLRTYYFSMKLPASTNHDETCTVCISSIFFKPFI
jgi:hypothetical protein